MRAGQDKETNMSAEPNSTMPTTPLARIRDDMKNQLGLAEETTA
jgi:hypothetical protein